MNESIQESHSLAALDIHSEDDWSNVHQSRRAGIHGRLPLSPAETLFMVGAASTLVAKARAVVTTQRFAALSREWKASRLPSSSLEKLAMHRAYQQIIGLGQDAIPLILKDLKATGAQWFWALTAITGENPVRPEHRGNVAKMTSDWFAWAASKGYKWETR